MHKIIGGLRQQAANTCRCPSCIIPQSQVGITRRAGTIASRATRTQILTSTTVLCSGIATAAAYVDADSKTRRRQQWDKVISDLQDDVAAATVRNDQKLLDKFDELSLIDTDKSLLDLVVDRLQLPGFGHLQEERLAWNSVYRDSPHQFETQWTPKKIAITNLATKFMKMRFLRLIRDNNPDLEQIYAALEQHGATSERQEKGARRSGVAYWLEAPTKSLKRCLHNLTEHLSSAWNASYDLGPREGSLHVYTRRKPSKAKSSQLNAELHRLFKAAGSEESSRWLCLALAVDMMNKSGVAPDLDTYNVLLAGLMKLGLPHTVSIAMHALRRCNLQPNEVTTSLALQHFTRTNHREGFERWLGLIRGEASGLSLLNTWDTPIDISDKSHLRRSDQNRKKVVHLPTPTPMVFSAMVAGKLHFDGFDEAVKMCQTMGAEGWFMDMDGLGPLLRDCAARQDLSAGTEIWQAALQMQQDSQSRRPSTTATIPKHVYAAMLDLCKATSNAQYEAIRQDFESVWPRESTTVTSDQASPIVEQLRSSAIRFRSEEKTESKTLDQHDTGQLTPTVDDAASIVLTEASSDMLEPTEIITHDEVVDQAPDKLPAASRRTGRQDGRALMIPWQSESRLSVHWGGMRSLSAASAQADSHGLPLSIA